MNKSQFHNLDDIDLEILDILQNEGRRTFSDLARQVNLSQPAVYNRVKRMEKRGIIRSYVALLDRELIGYDLLCFIHINIQAHSYEKISEFREAVLSLPQVLECHHLTGMYDYLLKVVLRNRTDLERFVVEKITALPGINQVQTSLVLSEVKSSTVLVLDII